MNTGELKKLWAEKFKQVPEVLENVKTVRTAATAFNTNVDAVLKMKGCDLEKLIVNEHLSLKELQNIRHTKLISSADVTKGIFKCFKNGIAEEWLTEDKKIYDWMVKNLGYDRLQMGGQGGIVANALAAVGVSKVIAHTNSLPKLQADQFLKLDNLVSYDEQGTERPAHTIDRKPDIPLIHWIIEFDKDDKVTVDGETFVCPKSNRFIATYDPLNLHLVVDKPFIRALESGKADYIVLSGFHALTECNDGIKLQDGIVPVIKTWKKNGSLIHLEIASTQDIAVRKALIEKIAPLADSVGINEREAIDILEVIGEEKQAEECNKHPTAVNMFKAILTIKHKIKCPRLQLHMYGLYMTLEDKGYKISPEANLRGMMLAATAAAGKAGTGDINHPENLLWAQGREVSDVGLRELEELGNFISDKKLVETGIGEYDGFDLIALPTIIIEKPLTLVGMGDTISSLSLVAAR